MEILHCDVARLQALLDNPGALFDPEFEPAFRFAIDELKKRPELFGFWTTLFVHEGEVCGVGGFKGPPDADGVVEIGYSIAPDKRCRGLATDAARELVRIAFADPRVRTVRAHTLAARNASVRVLEKNDFAFVKELIDPKEHDGPIWRWELQRK
jgi:ribosomal-protein-alanine N-acetyltransferase